MTRILFVRSSVCVVIGKVRCNRLAEKCSPVDLRCMKLFKVPVESCWTFANHLGVVECFRNNLIPVNLRHAFFFSTCTACLFTFLVTTLACPFALFFSINTIHNVLIKRSGFSVRLILVPRFATTLPRLALSFSSLVLALHLLGTILFQTGEKLFINLLGTFDVQIINGNIEHLNAVPRRDDPFRRKLKTILNKQIVICYVNGYVPE